MRTFLGQAGSTSSVHFYNGGVDGLLKFTKTPGALCELLRLEDVQGIAFHVQIELKVRNRYTDGDQNMSFIVI